MTNTKRTLPDSLLLSSTPTTTVPVPIEQYYPMEIRLTPRVDNIFVCVTRHSDHTFSYYCGNEQCAEFIPLNDIQRTDDYRVIEYTCKVCDTTVCFYPFLDEEKDT